MFKAIGNVLYKTPWWAMIATGVFALLLLVLFALPMHMIRLVDSGASPAENRAIQREIGMAVGNQALDLAKGILETLKERTTDADRRREFEHALNEINRARDELVRAQSGYNDAMIENAREAADSALEVARDAAQSAMQAATDARQAIEDARNDAIDRLRDKGVDITATLKSFEQLVVAARDNEAAARDALAAMNAMPASPAVPVAPAMPTVPQPPEIPVAPPIAPPPGPVASSTKAPLSIGVHWPGQRANDRTSLVLTPEVKGDIRAQVGSDVWRVAVGSALILTFIPLFMVLLIAKFFIGRSRRALALADRKTREAELSDVSRQVTEARLQALQAQVEPHFLYNTLANVQALNEVDPPAANLMVGHLIAYLRASLPKMRENTSTVGQELDLVRAYLNILQMRMGSRLAFAIAAGDDVLHCAFPPMMLPSLVENAIKHGLEPQREGGRIDVVVERLLETHGETLLVEVRDTGRGLSDAPLQAGGGVGLGNLRERLSAIYGAQGRFTITSNNPKGVIARIEVPVKLPNAHQSSQPSDRQPISPTGTSTPAKGWQRIWNATSKTHSLWARFLARTFMLLVGLLAALLIAGFVALLAGWMPVHLGDLQLDGIESLAIGSVGLLIGFGAAALALAVAVGVLYGMGFLLAGLLLLVAAAFLIGMIPAVAPFILIGLALWWVTTRKKP
jgi:hypothetical protein